MFVICFFANFYALHFVKVYMYHDAVSWHQECRVEFCIMAVEGATEFNWKMAIKWCVRVCIVHWHFYWETIFLRTTELNVTLLTYSFFSVVRLNVSVYCKNIGAVMCCRSPMLCIKNRVTDYFSWFILTCNYSVACCKGNTLMGIASATRPHASIWVLVLVIVPVKGMACSGRDNHWVQNKSSPS